MPEAPLNIDRVNDVTVLTITAGALLDGVTIELVGAEFERVVAEMGRCRLVIDMSIVKLMSSSALSVFLKLRELVEQVGGRVVFCSVRSALMKSFRIARLESRFEFFKTSAQAVQSFT